MVACCCADVPWGLVVIKPRGVLGKLDLKDSDGYSADCWFFIRVRIESAEKDELQSPVDLRQLKC